MKIQINAKIMLIISMVIFGTLGIFTRNIAISSGELALYRAILAAVLIFVYLIVTKQKNRFQINKKGTAAFIIIRNCNGHKLDSAF